MASVAPLGRFDLGHVIQRTVAVIGRQAKLLFGLSLLLAGLPAALLNYAQADAANAQLFVAGGAGFVSRSLAYGGGGLAMMFAGLLLQAALVRATISDLTGRQPGFGECLGGAVEVVLPLLGVAILVALGIGLGLILFFVPGIIAWVMWSVAVPALVEERGGAIASMARSRALTKGSRWQILVLLVLLAVAGWMLGAALRVVLVGGGAGVASALVAGLGQTVHAMVSATMVAVIYIDLREARDGATPAALAAIFA